MALVLNDAPTARLSADDLAAWRQIPTAIISDELNRTGTMHAAIKAVGPGMGFAGQALTAQTMVGDSGTLHYALTTAWPGAVLVVDARGHQETAVWGGILTAGARARKVAAVIIDGAVRDVAELRDSGVAVYARAVSPNGPHKGFGGSVNSPIQCAGVAVDPGDVVVGDDDGIVVIRPDQLPGLMERCRARIAKEEVFLEKIEAGVATVELMGLPPADEIG
ncbi:MAG: RraA family protein [Thermoanaerobaculia bacterium]